MGATLFAEKSNESRRQRDEAKRNHRKTTGAHAQAHAGTEDMEEDGGYFRRKYGLIQSLKNG